MSAIYQTFRWRRFRNHLIIYFCYNFIWTVLTPFSYARSPITIRNVGVLMVPLYNYTSLFGNILMLYETHFMVSGHILLLYIYIKYVIFITCNDTPILNYNTHKYGLYDIFQQICQSFKIIIFHDLFSALFKYWY